MSKKSSPWDYRLAASAIVAACLLSSCSLMSPTTDPQPTHIAEPPRISAMPTPDGGQLGGLDGVFVSVDSMPGYQDGYNCYHVFRLFPDGLVLMHDAMCVQTATFGESWPRIRGAFDRETSRVSHGEYHRRDGAIWLVITYDYGFRTAYRDFRGNWTDNRVSLVELNLYYKASPNALPTPKEYVWLDTPVPMNK